MSSSSATRRRTSSVEAGSIDKRCALELDLLACGAWFSEMSGRASPVDDGVDEAAVGALDFAASEESKAGRQAVQNQMRRQNKRRGDAPRASSADGSSARAEVRDMGLVFLRAVHSV